MSSGRRRGQAQLERRRARRSGRYTRIAPMPRAPRSWTANSSRISRTSLSPWTAHADTASIHVAVGGSCCHVSPSQRSTPNVADDPHRPVRVALHDASPPSPRRARRGRARSRPVGRTRPTRRRRRSRRISQLDRPSANRRAPVSGIASTGRRVTVELGADLPRLRRGGRLDDRPDARHAPLVDVGVAGRSRARSSTSVVPLGIARASDQPASASSSRNRRSAARVFIGIGQRVIGAALDAVEEGAARRRRSPCRCRTSRATSCAPAGGTRRAACGSTIRLPTSPSSALTNFDEPCVVMATIRRTLCRRACSAVRLRRAGPRPRRATHTRSIQPLSIAGWPLHHVG